MVPEHQHQKLGKAEVFTKVRRVRRAADRVLRQLLIDRAMSERRQAELGKSDPLKSVTGHSALDEAIHTTEGIIRHIDDELDRRSSPAANVEDRTTTPEPLPVGS